MKTVFTLVCLCLFFNIKGQGITTCQITGNITDQQGTVVADAQLLLSDLRTNNTYKTSTSEKGNYVITNIRSGSDYSLKVTVDEKEYFIFENERFNVGERYIRNYIVNTLSVEVETVNISAQLDDDVNIKAGRLGTLIQRDELEMFPSINRSILDYLTLNPMAGAVGFLGKGSRANYISVDGAGFNNVFGIGGPTAAIIGNVIGAEPFGVDALEEIQIKLNPYDVNQGGFTGGGIHATTRSGSNEFSALLYSYYGSDAIVGNSIGGVESPVSSFSNLRLGFNLSGPIIKDKLFFFANYERNDLTSPGSNFLAARPGLEGQNVTRVQASDLDDISAFLKDNYDYETGPYESFDFQTKNSKWMIKLDLLINDRNRFSFRVSRLEGTMDDDNTNSGAFGSGNRVDNLNSMSFLNSGLVRTVEATSYVGELVSNISSKIVNRFSFSYGIFPDSRKANGTPFPAVDILQGGQTYLSFGSHMFASANRIDQKNFQLRNEFTSVLGDHIIKLGAVYENHDFEYDFTPAFYGSYVFNSLEDFYNSTPIGTLTPIGLSNGIGRPSEYSLRYATEAAGDVTSVNPKYSQASLYINDEWQAGGLFLNFGVRLDYNIFGGSPLENPDVSGFEFQDANGEVESYSTSQLPDNHIIISPRFGFEYLLPGSDKFVLRGGAGIFSGFPSMVRIGDQFLNNGVLQGEINARNNQANRYPFNPDVESYVPEERSAPESYDLNFVVSDYKAPSLHRSNVGLDYFIQKKLRLSFDVSYGRDINADHVRNANIQHLNPGVASDGRPVFESSMLNSPVIGAYVLDNSSGGDQLFYSVQLKKDYDKDWFGALSYTYGKTTDINSFGASTTRTAFRNLPVRGNANDPGVFASDFDLRHKVLLYVGKSFNLFGFGHTSLSTVIEAAQQGRFSYTYSSNGDVNNDGINSNDLIYIPTDASDIELESYNMMGTMVTAEEQWEALDVFISQSDYLNANRGSIAERNGSVYPWYVQANLKLVQNIAFAKGSQNIDVVIDIFNLPNLLNSSWGVRKFVATPRPIQARSNGKFRVNPSQLKDEFVNDTSIFSRWQLQLGLKYRFN